MKNLTIITTSGQKAIILDKVAMREIVRKTNDKWEAARNGYNLDDAINKLGEITIDKYMCRILYCPHKINQVGDIVFIEPSNIKSILA